MTMWKVMSCDRGKTLRSFLKDKIGMECSLRKIKWAIDHNLTSINGAVERHSTAKIYTGDMVECRIDQIDDGGSDNKERILYEDHALLVYDKKPWMTTTDGGLLESLRMKYRELEAVHRLDRDTSGVVLFVKKKEYLERVESQFRDHTVEKVYWAVTEGIPQQKDGVIHKAMKKIGEKHGRAVWGVSPDGKEAITAWRIITTGKKLALIECRPQTGRTHQIRVHLASEGYPILGDIQYGKRGSFRYKATRVMLHAKEITFFHPETGVKMVVEAPIPEDMKKVVRYIEGKKE